MPYFNPDLSYPVPVNPNWGIQDSSKVKNCMSCWRGYFFEHVLGWRIDRPNIHLIFGSAWHEAMAILHREGFNKTTVQKAFHEGFLPYYRRFIDQEDDEIYTPKTPARAYLALCAYVIKKQETEQEYELVYHNGEPMIEIGGSVSLSETRDVHFRLDTILKSSRGYISREHKTGSSTWGWELQWFLSTQIGTYSHVLYCLYPEEEVAGVVVDGTFFKKTKDDVKKDSKDPFRHFDFMSVPVYKSPSNMNQWLNTTLWWLDMIEWNFNMLSKCRDSDEVMHAFPQNPESCNNYFGCNYHSLCMAWANPLRHVDRVPIGYRTEFWNPTEEPVKVELHLEERKI